MKNDRRVLLALTLSLAGVAHAQDLALSYTDEQADGALPLYQSTCASCHGGNFDDGALGPPLKGVQFMQKFGGGTAAELYALLQTTMPTGQPGTLAPSEYAGLTALILRENLIVAGQAEGVLGN